MKSIDLQIHIQNQPKRENPKQKKNKSTKKKKFFFPF